MLRAVGVACVIAACYSPHPQPGSPCPDGACAAPLVCEMGTQICVRPQDVPDAAICTPDQILCSGACVDPTSDPNHCGGCTACSIANATAACVGGQCELVACTANACMINGSCETVTFDSDPQHCGNCTTACSSGTCTGGACVLRAFVTVNTYNADLGGLAGADSKCQAEAVANALGGKWKAWLGGGSGPATRFTHGQAPYVRLDGAAIAQNWNKLTQGTLLHPLNVMANKATATTATCWTDVTAAGSVAAAGNCTNWSVTTSTISGGIGTNSATTSTWTAAGSQSCDPTTAAAAALYCFEQ